MIETHLTINHLSLCIQRWGHTPSIYILHGWLDQAASWEVVANQLHRKGHHILTYDHRGHGKSDHAPPASHYHFPDYVADLSLLHQHHQHEPITLIGHSMGGTIASIYASLFPSRVRKLILVEGLGPAEESGSAILARYKKHILQREVPRTQPVFSSVDEAAERLCAHHPSLDIERARYLAKRQLIPHENSWVWSFDPRHKEKAAISFSLSRHLDILRNISCPCSLIFGSESPYAQWIDVAKRSEAIPNLAQTYYIEGGHSPHITHPHHLSKVLISILS